MAFCLGGMGSRTKNFYNDLAARMGFAKAAAEIQDRFLVGDYARAAAAVPLDFLDSVSLFGSRERMADRMQSFANAGVTTLVITPASPQPEVAIASIRIAVEAMEEAGLA
jgi:alkanesulfonate monooxygenase SsuD/methylene tetrahydromethanopterin reductase-like flavin-dependent oxidoreductase (luciferase family)